MSRKPFFLNINGIPSLEENENCYRRDIQGAWVPTKNNSLLELEEKCQKIYNALEIAIFGSKPNYFNVLQENWSTVIYLAGLNSESSCSRVDFEKFARMAQGNTEICSLLYHFDFRNLISGIQECNKEILYLSGDFYYFFNTEDLFYPETEMVDGLRYFSSPATTRIIALLNSVFIRMHSLLDYITKLSLEVHRIRVNPVNYDRLVSKNDLFNRNSIKKIKFIKEDTLFEPCTVVKQIELYRHRVIHHGFFDDQPKIYAAIKNGKITEKYILYPDQNSDNSFEKYKNRQSFFSREDKINLRLPQILMEFQSRQKNTLESIYDYVLQSSG